MSAQLLYSYVLYYPEGKAPFDRDRESRWRAFLGEFVKPIADKYPDLLFWCSEYGSCTKFRVYSELKEVHAMILRSIEDMGLHFNPKEEEEVTVLSDLGDGRFIDQRLDDNAKKRRAELTLKFLCATVRLHVDSLVRGDGQYWEYQPTPHSKENPLGNNFESLGHLLGNITRFEFELKNGNQTVWQFQKPPGNTRLSLWR